MEAKTVGAFAIGFSTGLLCLCVTLWSTGALRSARGLHTQAASPPAARMAALPAALPAMIVPVPGVDINRLTDTFNDPRDGRKHEALDIPAPRGTPVRAAVEGNVVKLFHSKPGGTTVYQFDDSRNYCYYYAHLDRYAPGLQEGTLLRQGEVLGYVGTTGNAPPNVPHLHFAVFRLGPQKQWWKGVPLDPLPLFKRE